MQYTVTEAEAKFDQLLDEAATGHEVIITLQGTPAVRVVPVVTEKPKRVPGRLEGQGCAARDAFDPLTDEELKSGA